MESGKDVEIVGGEISMMRIVMMGVVGRKFKEAVSGYRPFLYKAMKQLLVRTKAIFYQLSQTVGFTAQGTSYTKQR